MIRRRRLLVIFAAMIVVGVCSWNWLLHTESGARWIWARAQSATGGALRAQQLQGDIGSGLTIRRLTFATDSITFEVEELLLLADVDLLPLQVQISNVVISDTMISINAAEKVAENKNHRSLIESLSLPLSLLFTDVSADRITVSSLAPENDIVLTQTRLAGSWHDEIVIERLLINSLGSSANISAALELTSPFAATLSGEVSTVSAPGVFPEPIDIQFHGEGNLEELSINISSSPVSISIQGTLANVLDSLSWDLQARLLDISLQLGKNDTEVQIAEGHAASSGTMQEYMLAAAATIDAPKFEPFQFNTTGKGTTTSFDFSELSLRSKDADLSGHGRITWGEDWLLESQLNVAAFNLHTLLDNWPVVHPVRGELSLLLDQSHLLIKDSYLTAGDTGMSVHADGTIDLLASVVAGDLRWKNAIWPLLGNEPTISSKSGKISVGGTLDDWRINGTVEVATSTMPSGQFRIDGSGDRHHVETTIIDSEVLGGKVSGYATFSWRNQQAWSAGLDTSGISLSSFGDDWPDDVTGRFDAEGRFSPFLLDLQLSDIVASFRGGPLSANGQVTLSDDQFTASDLKILHGETHIDLHGDPFARSGLDFDVAVDDASRYIDAASGAFAIAGRVSLHPEQLALRIDANSEAFSFHDIYVSGLQLVDRSGDNSVINAEIKAEQLNINGKVFDSISASLLADTSAQKLQLDASYGDADVHLFAAGKLDDLEHPSSWLGEVRELSFELDEEPLAELAEPILLSLSMDSITFDRGCIAAPAGMRLCAQAKWSADNYLDVGADLIDVPVDLLNRFIDTDVHFDQLLNGNVKWSQRRESGTTGNAKITMSAGTMVAVDYPDMGISTDTGLLSFDIADGQLLSGKAELSMPGFGHIDAQMSIPDFTQGTNSKVSGLLDLDLSDMAVLAAFLPLIDAANGEFRADLTLSGTLAEPALVGDLAVNDGSMTYLPLGLQLDEINLTSLLHDDGQFELSGEFQAGDGRGEIITRKDFARTGAKGLELELRGKNMTLIDVPNVTARVDLDVRVGYDYDTLSLDGQILIPQARVEPSNLTVSRDTESEDVVIVAGELPEDSRRQAREQKTWIKGSIGVEFGDDVSVDLGPATANVTGNTIFSWQQDLIPIADGQYDVTGSIQAFGQVLEITEGGLRFPKIPADNPFIRIRAEREIFGNAQVRTAGVLVDGTLKQPTIGAYTRPLTTEERALTLLVTGSDFDFEQGVGAINFGTYIAPKVFVSYGVGLFETENVIRIRYDLKRGFGITATSGEKETGLDLSYRIER